MKTLVAATHNPNKIKEFLSLLPDGIEVIPASQFNVPEPDETELTLEGNSNLKAEFVFSHTCLPSVADDTGLEVEALNGEPGVFSARYAGEPANNQNNIAKLLSTLADKPNRKARFRTIITYKTEAKTHQFEGIVNGEIALIPAGTNGFGYDSVFIPEDSSKTFAEMDLTEKNQFSHRARAMKKFLEFIKANP